MERGPRPGTQSSPAESREPPPGIGWTAASRVAADETGSAAAPERILLAAGVALEPRLSGALFWGERRLLVVGDLHLGRSERLARDGLDLLPPYETEDTLNRLEAEISALAPRIVICLGDSFDDLAAAERLSGAITERIDRLSAGRRWIWIAGNHDPGPVGLPGTHLAEVGLGPLHFRHIADPDARLRADEAEVSAHYHPKARLEFRGHSLSRRCFLADARRLILPAFGSYTGGLDIRDAAFDPLVAQDARAFLIGRRIIALPRAGFG